MPNKILTQWVMPQGLTKQEQTDWKSLRLAELIPRWSVLYEDTNILVRFIGGTNLIYKLNPYADTMEGKAQAYEILMAYIEVISKFKHFRRIKESPEGCDYDMGMCWRPCKPTQANINDQILIMEGCKL